MKKIIFLLFILVCPILTNAQNLEVEWGPTYKKDGSIFSSQIFVGYTKDHYYLLSRPRKKNELLQFDFNHKLNKVSPVAFQHKGKKLIISSVINTTKGSYFIASNYDKKKKTDFVYASKLKEDGSIDKKARPIFSYPYKRKNAYFFLPGMGSFNQDIDGHSVSPDSTKIVFSRVENFKESKKRKGKDKYHLFVFDQNLEKIWNKKITLPYSDKDIEIEDFGISNNGEVYIIATVQESKKRKKGTPDYDYILFRINEEGVISKMKISLENAAPTDAIIHYHEDRSLYVTGFYTDKDKKSVGAHGVFMVKYNQEDEVLFSKKHPWEGSIRDELLSKKDKKKGRGVYSFPIDDVLVDYENESISFVAENRYMTTSTSIDGQGRTRHETIYHSNDIIVPNLSFDGELKWIHHIEKSFRSSGYFKTSNVFANRNGNIYLIFNDSKSRNERKNMKTKKRAKRNARYTDIVRINTKGDLDLNQTIFNSKEIDTEFLPIFSRSTNNGEVLLYGARRKKYQYGLIKLPD